jgi:hypothetical protein
MWQKSEMSRAGDRGIAQIMQKRPMLTGYRVLDFTQIVAGPPAPDSSPKWAPKSSRWSSPLEAIGSGHSASSRETQSIGTPRRAPILYNTITRSGVSRSISGTLRPRHYFAIS